MLAAAALSGVHEGCTHVEMLVCLVCMRAAHMWRCIVMSMAFICVGTTLVKVNFQVSVACG